MELGKAALHWRVKQGGNIGARDRLLAYCPAQAPFPLFRIDRFRTRFGVNKIRGAAIWLFRVRIGVVFQTDPEAGRAYARKMVG